MSKKKKDNIVHLHRAPKINVGTILLLVILIYLIISVVLYITKEKVLIYEVTAGSLTAENTFTGVIIMDEQLEYSPVAGYVNYFLPEKERASVNTIICSVDETGNIYNQINSEESDNKLNSSTLQSIRKELTGYAKSHNDMELYKSYNTLDSIDSRISEYTTHNLVSKLNEIIVDENTDFLHIIKPESSRIISFYTDSLFGLTSDDINMEVFQKQNLNVTNLKTQTLVGAGSPLYRVINSEKWQIAFPLSENQAAQYSEITSVKIKILNYNLSLNAELSIINNSDGIYGLLTLNKYLINFMDMRYLEFELSEATKEGLKIPVSSVCEKEFFTIPVEYGTYGGQDKTSTGFMLLKYQEDGSRLYTFVEATYYNNENGYYYVNKDLFNIGDCIVKDLEGQLPNQIDENCYIVGTVASLKGAYCINKGYCQFRKVEILDSNQEYYIIKRGTSYGLSIYDHIVLNSELASENKVLYQ